MANPYIAGEYYTGQYIGEEFVQIFSEIGIDRRVAILVDISPKAEISKLMMTHNPTLTHPYNLVDPNNPGAFYNYFYMHNNNGVGQLVGSNVDQQFSTFSDSYLHCGVPPTYLTFVDELQNAQYVTVNPTTHTLVASSSVPNVPDLSRGQYIGDTLEWISDDGKTIFVMSVDSSNQIHIEMDRVERERIEWTRIQNGHPFAYDGINVYNADLISLDDISIEIDEVEGGFSGVAIARVGSLHIQLADQAYDYLINQSWATREIIVRVGLTDADISTYRVVLRSHTERMEANLNELTIVLRDISIRLDKSMQENTYKGTGGYEGGADVTGVLKPLTFGWVRHVTPVLIDKTLNLYQVHDGAIGWIAYVYTGGRVLNNVGLSSTGVPYPSGMPPGMTSLTQWNPSQTEVNLGGYLVDLQKGVFRLAAPPTAPITVEVFGSTLLNNSTLRIADVTRAILQYKVPEISVNQNSFDKYFTDQSGISGIYIDSEQSVKDALEQLVKPLGALIAIDAVNVLSINQIKTQSPIALFVDNNVLEDDQPTVRPAPRPGAMYRFGYQKIWTVLNESDFLDISIQFKDLISKAYRYAEVKWYGTGTTRLPVWDNAKTITWDTNLDDPREAGHVAVWVSHRDHSLQHIYEFTVIGYSYQIPLGATVAFKISKLNIHTVKTGIVVGITEKSLTSSQEDFTRFKVWA